MSKTAPRVLLNFAPDEDVNPATGEENQNFIYSDDDESEEEIIAPIEKEIPTEDIFESEPEPPKPEEPKPKPKLKTSVRMIDPLVEKRTTPKSTKRHNSAEHMKKMQEGARLARERKKAARDAEKSLANEEKELLTKKKKKDIEKLKKSLEEDDEIPADVYSKKQSEPQQSINPNQMMLSKEDLAKIQFEAIASYEVLRKDRKAKKREAQKLETEKNNLMRTLNNVQQPKRFTSIYDNCY